MPQIDKVPGFVDQGAEPWLLTICKANVGWASGMRWVAGEPQPPYQHTPGTHGVAAVCPGNAIYPFTHTFQHLFEVAILGICLWKECQQPLQAVGLGLWPVTTWLALSSKVFLGTQSSKPHLEICWKANEAFVESRNAADKCLDLVPLDILEVKKCFF